MKKQLRVKNARRTRRKSKIRKKIKGTHKRPRMSVYKSNRHMYVQVINDEQGNTIAAVSNLDGDHKELTNTVTDGEKLGQAIGEKLKEQNIETVVFDRNGHLYHGVVKAIAEGTRKTGIKL